VEVAKRRRGRPRKEATPPAPAPETPATPAEPADGMVTSLTGERIEATDAVKAAVLKVYNKAVRESLSADEAEAAKAQRLVDRYSDFVERLTAANAVWRRKITETGKSND
jgi:hypothetical protein